MALYIVQPKNSQKPEVVIPERGRVFDAKNINQVQNKLLESFEFRRLDAEEAMKLGADGVVVEDAKNAGNDGQTG